MNSIISKLCEEMSAEIADSCVYFFFVGGLTVLVCCYLISIAYLNSTQSLLCNKLQLLTFLPFEKINEPINQPLLK